MKIAVIGAGSVGLMVAATSVVAGVEVCIVARGKSAEALRGEGIRVTGVLGEHVISPEKFSVCGTDVPLPACDAIVVATKAAEVVSALRPFASNFKADGKSPFVLLLQNGWGSAQEAREIVPAGTAIFSGSILTGIERLSPTEIRINVHGDAARVGSLFGDDPAPLRALIEVWQRGFHPFIYEPEIDKVILKKLLFSLCLNPLSALLRCTYGQLSDNPRAVELMRMLADEAMKAIAASRRLTLFKDGADYVRNYLIGARVIAKTGAHRSSMLQDIEAGRKTEIGYITGAIAKMGRESGVPTPCNDMITGLILALESTGKT